MTDLTIREARDSDREAIRAVTLAAYSEYAPIMRDHWEGYQQNILASLANVAPAEQFVAEVDGELAGAVLLLPAHVPLAGPDGRPLTLPWPEIRLLAVTPAARGRGVGAALVRECLRRARQAGADAITLHTTDMMRVAQAMYVRLGFQRAPETDFEPVPGVTIKGYRLSLPGEPSA